VGLDAGLQLANASCVPNADDDRNMGSGCACQDSLKRGDWTALAVQEQELSVASFSQYGNTAAWNQK
jgi:hypothetical protein